MSFDFDQIDTGNRPEPNMFAMQAADIVLEHTRAQNPDASADQINSILAGVICGEMRARKTHKGICNTFWKYAELISAMRTESEAMHDMIILEFAERLTEVG